MALSNFDNEMKTVWSDRTLAAFDTKAVFASVTNRSYDGDAKLGKTVIINTVGDFTLFDYNLAITNGEMTSSDFDITSQSLAIDKWYYFNKRYDDLSQLWGNADTFDKLVNRGADAFVKAVDTTISGLHTTFAYSSSAGSAISATPSAGTSSYAYDAIVDMGTTLINAGVPVESGECFVIVAPEVAGLLAKDSRFTNHLTYLQNGIIDGGKINNMQVYVSANTPTSGSGHWLIAGHPEAWAFASAVQNVRTIPNPNMFGNLFQGQLVYGAKVINQKGLYKKGVHII